MTLASQLSPGLGRRGMWSPADATPLSVRALFYMCTEQGLRRRHRRSTPSERLRLPDVLPIRSVNRTRGQAWSNGLSSLRSLRW